MHIKARNVLVLTLIIDNGDQAIDLRLWNIYHHIYIDDDSLQLLCSQAKKLAELATPTTWDAHVYGKCLKFCDDATLEELGGIWRSYDVQALTADDQLRMRTVFESELKRAIDYKRERNGQTQVLSGFRSAAPASFSSLNDVPKLHHQFWETGKTEITKVATPHINPMFAAHLTGSATLHYGLDPLLGFHLATAYVPLQLGSQLRSTESTAGPQKVVKAAQLQFRTWAQAFWAKVQTGLVVRFFAGEALRFCHALQLQGCGGATQSPNTYRKLYDSKPLILGSMYNNHEAPVSFNTIDTSNLMDHVGAINLLVAASPLLDNTPSATLYTESLVRRHKSTDVFVREMLCGDFPTMSMLLGLFPTEYWTNATGVSSVDEAMLNRMFQAQGKGDVREGQLYSRLAWHRPPIEAKEKSPTKLEIAAADLAQVMYRMYLKMFQSEDVKCLLMKPDLSEIQNMGLPQFHRGSFVVFLSCIQARLTVDWDKAILKFLSMLHEETTLLIGAQYLHELYALMHLLHVHSVDMLRSPGHSLSVTEPPQVLSVTLRVPRAMLKVFTGRPLTRLGTPPVLCAVQSSKSYGGKPWQNFFACVHMMFGEITTKGRNSVDSLDMSVVSDSKGWSGNSDLVVCFYAPRWTLFQEPEKAYISLRLQSAPLTMGLFLNDLGMELKIYETTLGNQRNVFISKYLPNQSEPPSIRSSWLSTSSNASHHEDYSTSMVTVFSSIEARCEALKGRISFHSLNLKVLLKDGATVEVFQKTPTTSLVSVKGFAKQIPITFPTPINMAKCKTRIARSSSYVELEAPIHEQKGQGEFPFFAFPLQPYQLKPTLKNLPYVRLPWQPIIDIKDPTKIQWLVPHVSLAF